MNRQFARIADREEDYARLGLKPGQIAAWEDGMRTSGDRGSYEWWYFDTHLEDGSSMVITFYTKPMLSPKGPEAPLITVDLDRPGQPKKHLMLNATSEQFSASRETCNVHIKDSYFRGDLHTYQIKVVDEGISIDVELVGQVPAWRPGTGHIYFGEHDDHLFAWLPSVPQGKVTATITEKGSSRTLTGIGYHDHNWGDVAMAKLLNHWYWGRAQAGPYAIVASYLYAEKAYGQAELPIFMLAKNGKVVADVSSKATLLLEDEQADPKSGKPVANRVIYNYKDDQNHYRVTFQRSETILDLRFADMVTGFKHILARMANVDGAYLRFTGTVSVERYVGDEIVEQASDPGIWELMYFGHVE
jgi:CrtC N-terminal lipocalin domain